MYSSRHGALLGASFNLSSLEMEKSDKGVALPTKSALSVTELPLHVVKSVQELMLSHIEEYIFKVQSP